MGQLKQKMHGDPMNDEQLNIFESLDLLDLFDFYIAQIEKIQKGLRFKFEN
jgi:hypothetical protein